MGSQQSKSSIKSNYWCTNCCDYYDSSDSEINRCSSCKKISLAHSEVKNLNDWFSSSKINEGRKDRLIELGVEESEKSKKKYPLNDLIKLAHYHEALERRKPNLDGEIHLLIFFSTWFNNNCVITITGDGSYSINLISCEMSSRKMIELLEVLKISDNVYYSLSEAKTVAYKAEEKLNGDSPILYSSPSLEISYSSSDHLASAFKEVKSRVL